MQARIVRSTPGVLVLVTLLLALATLWLPTAALAADLPWTAQKSGTTQALYGVSFTSGTTGWVAGGGGAIRRTTDGGTTWKAQTSRTTQTLYAIRFTDARNGCAVGGRGTLVQTTDGATWSVRSSGTTQNLYALAFADASTGWAVGARSTVLRTTDGGATWTVAATGGKEAYYGVACADASTVWVVGSKGVVRKSTDGGVSWTSQSSGTRSTLNAVACSGAGVAWIAGNGGVVRTTTNGGASWTARSAGTSQTLNAVVADGGGRVRVAGSSGVVRVSADGGGLWAGEATGTTQALYGAAWRGGQGWIVGAGGTILSYRPDTAPPVTSATGLQADDHSGWTNAAVTVSLSATDTGTAGVAFTSYTIDGGDARSYTAPFQVTGQGHHVVTYWSVDAVGNTEGARAGHVNIDTTPPTVTSDADAAWHAGDVTVHLTAADSGGSGVAATQYRAAGSADWTTAAGDRFVVPASSTQGPHSFDIRSLDGAGNASATGSCTVKIDATAPVTTATGLGADQLSEWSSTSRTVTLSAADGAGSGVTGTYYTVDGGATKSYAAPFSVSGVGQHPVTYWSTDAIGNIEAVRTGWVNISDPYAQSENLAADLDSRWSNGTVTVKITGHGTPGPLSIHYLLDDVARPAASSPCTFDVSGVGHHKVEFWATNGNGAESLHQTGYVNIDTTAPKTTLKAGAPAGWVNHAVTLVFLAGDDHAGVAATFSALDGGAAVEGSSCEVAAPADHSSDGKHTVTYWSSDRAGNVETAASVVVRVDTRRPVTRAPYSASAMRGRTAKLRFVVKDQAPCAGTAAAKVVVKNARGRTVKTVKVARVRTGVTATASFRCKLARGKYRFLVYATDAAGNMQSKIGSNRLTVR